MSESMFLAIAIFVFVLLLTGLILTVIEFRTGAPSRQQKRAEGRGENDLRGKAGVDAKR
ncbi:MAG: hypothetical protein ABR550_12295 [Wenzhouxiangellaceae bacterium]